MGARRELQLDYLENLATSESLNYLDSFEAEDIHREGNCLRRDFPGVVLPVTAPSRKRTYLGSEIFLNNGEQKAKTGVPNFPEARSLRACQGAGMATAKTEAAAKY